MRPAAALLLLAVVAGAAPDGYKTWRSEMRRLRNAEKEYWRDFRSGFNTALQAFVAPLEAADAKPDENKEAGYDYSELRKLFADFEAIEKGRGDAARALAASGSSKARATLLKALLDLGKEIESLDEDLASAKPKFRYYMLDPELGIRRHGAGARRAGLMDALATTGPSFLASEAWSKAERADGKDTFFRRVAVIDAIARGEADEEAEAFLEGHARGPDLPLRIAAAEGLFRFGEAGRRVLTSLLDGESRPLRRAILDGVRAHPDPAWVAILTARLADAPGQLRDAYVAALGAQTKQQFGFDPKRWSAWAEDRREDIEDGEFHLEDIEPEEAKPEPAPGSVTFYGIRSASDTAGYLLPAGRFLLVPANWEVQRTRYRELWPGLLRQWNKVHKSHRDVFLEQLDLLALTMPEDYRFNVGMLQRGLKLADDKKLLEKKASAFKAARYVIEQAPARGWHSPLQAIRRLAEFEGLDTVFLVCAGELRGGAYLTPESAVAAFRRWNRFHRIVVHTIRIGNEKEAAETFLKGLATTSGGQYTWMKEPPE